MKWIKGKLRIFFKSIMQECIEEGYRLTFKFEIVYPDDTVQPFQLRMDSCYIVGGIEIKERIKEDKTVATFDLKEKPKNAG